MTPLTSEEIRQFAENCGWKRTGLRSHSPACQADIENCGGKMPDFAHDLNACFEALERFVKPRGWAWQLTHGPNGALSCALMVRFRCIAFECGETKQAAIIRAVNAAQEKS